MMDSKALAKALGRKNIAAAVGFRPTAVSNAVVRGWFPATWFIAVSELAAKAGVECPPELFKMVIPGNTHNVDSVGVRQVGAAN